MPQPRKPEVLQFPIHLTCPNCLIPMHVRTAEAADGHNKLRFLCTKCGTEALRDYSSRQ